MVQHISICIPELSILCASDMRIIGYLKFVLRPDFFVHSIHLLETCDITDRRH